VLNGRRRTNCDGSWLHLAAKGLEREFE
jgi:hypothetical protein